MSEKNLVHVDLQNLLFGEQMLQLEGQQHLINLAGVGFFGRQVDIACHLHADGRSALAFGAAEVGQTRADHSHVVHATMFKEACVLRRQYGVFHDLGDLADGRQFSALFAVFGEKLTFG